MKNFLSAFFIFIFLIGITSFASSADFTPQGDINLRGVYQVKNGTNSSFAYYCNQPGTTCYTLAELAASSSGDITSVSSLDSYIVVAGGSSGDVNLSLNGTELNNTIIAIADARDNDTTYTAEELILYLDGTTFRINMTVFNSSASLLVPSTLSSFTDDLGDRGYTNLLNFTNGPGFYNSSKINSSELEEQGDGNLGIVDSFIQSIANSRIAAVVTQAFVKALGFYTGAETDANLTAGLATQDECSEITGCVTGAITDGNTGWDNSYGFFNSIENFTGTLTDAQYCTYDQANNQINCTSAGGGGSTYYGGTGIEINASNNISILLAYQVPQGCNDGEIAEYNTTSGGWDCGVDNTAASGMASWVLAASDTGGSETITDGETVTIADDNAYINITRSTNTITVSLYETKLNATIDARDSDTTYTAGTGLILTATEFSVNTTYLDENYVGQSEYPNLDTDSTDDFDGAWGSLTGVPAGFADDVDNDTQLSGAEIVAQVGNFSDENSTLSRIGDCPSGQFVQNTTTGGVECLTPSYYTDSDISGSETAFDGWDKNAADDFDGAFSSLTGVDSDACTSTDKVTNVTISNGVLTIVCAADEDTGTSYTNGSGISLVGNQFNHSDTSSQADSDNSGNTVIQDIILDEFGHITSIVTRLITFTDLDFSGTTGFDDLVDNDTTYTGGDGITLVGTVFNFDGGTAPGGELGGTWASPTVDSAIFDDEYIELGDTFGGEVSGTYDNLVIGNDVLDDQYYDSEADLTGLLDDNYEPISAHFDASTTTNITCFNSACTWYNNASDDCEYLSNGGKRCAI